MAKLIFIALIILTALLVIAIKFLPWWGSILLLVGIAFAIRFGGGYLFKRMLLIPFKVKGKALSNAEVEVHSVTLASEPIREATSEEDEEYLREERLEDQQLVWYFFDLTITPQPKSEGFIYWEPGEIIFARMDTKPHQLDEDDSVSKLHDYKIFEGETFQEDEDCKYQGPLRLKFHAGLQPHLKEVQLRYYFELFGNIEIPSFQ
ncbi:hypothetical protein [Acaryochloris marina]|uniref:hypothetical protein n=1 Tax=Acaryochloris marina TaxID=155978 RepID=UPI0021C31179|nr:hypothetical protein [Acaryochloris marina]BDM83890.1 hypothetical protein AM10699_67510 [Acaryochloris marina MBIC10699]